jgi:hypothetical protein
MAPLGPPKVMKVWGGRSPRLKPGVKSGLLGVTFAGGGGCEWGIESLRLRLQCFREPRSGDSEHFIQIAHGEFPE